MISKTPKIAGLIAGTVLLLFCSSCASSRIAVLPGGQNNLEIDLLDPAIQYDHCSTNTTARSFFGMYSSNVPGNDHVIDVALIDNNGASDKGFAGTILNRPTRVWSFLGLSAFGISTLAIASAATPLTVGLTVLVVGAMNETGWKSANARLAIEEGMINALNQNRGADFYVSPRHEIRIEAKGLGLFRTGYEGSTSIIVGSFPENSKTRDAIMEVERAKVKQEAVAVGQKVFFVLPDGREKEGVVVSLLDAGYIRVEYQLESGRQAKKTVSISDIKTD